jgi:hypothetical protein
VEAAVVEAFVSFPPRCGAGTTSDSARDGGDRDDDDDEDDDDDDDDGDERPQQGSETKRQTKMKKTPAMAAPARAR